MLRTVVTLGRKVTMVKVFRAFKNRQPFSISARVSRILRFLEKREKNISEFCQRQLGQRIIWVITILQIG